MTDSIIQGVREELIEKNSLRVGINASNFLLVSSIDSDGLPFGIAPDLGRLFAHQLEVTPEFVIFENKIGTLLINWTFKGVCPPKSKTERLL